mgnify:CR=1 FL=1
MLHAISPRHNPPQQGTLNRLLKPFRLCLSLVPQQPSRGESLRDARMGEGL